MTGDSTVDLLHRFLTYSQLNGVPSKSLYSSLVIVSILNSCHCCFHCCLRFLGCPNFSVYGSEEKKLYEAFNNLCIEHELPKLIDPADSVCAACLGSVQFADTYVDDLCQKIEEEGYIVDSCFLTCTLPTGILVRDHLLKEHTLVTIAEKYSGQDFTEDLIRLWKDVAIREPKDYFKYLFGIKLKEKTGYMIDNDSPFHANVVIGHEATAKEHMFLAELKEPLLKMKTVRQKRMRVTVGDSRYCITEALKKLDLEEARKVTAVPPLPPAEPAKFESVALRYTSSYVGGRYLKFSREYSQTPWNVRGQKLTEHSVSEVFLDLIKKYHRADDTKFCTAGREDANVRMLGTGRPFYFEVVNPRKPRLSDEEYKKLEEEINSQPLHKDNVQVRDLQYIEPKYTTIIKEGEESKTKRYRALVWLSEPLTDELIERINKVGSTPFTIHQKTPLRVFQRRGAAVRPKVIHTSTISRLHSDVDMASPQAHFGVLKLHTQAGTYIKEYVHGDLGRTMPNLASVAGIFAADLLELDVMDVDLAWPPVKESKVEADISVDQSNTNNKRVHVDV